MYHQRILHSTYINHIDIILREQTFFPGKPYWCMTGNVIVPQTNIAAYSLFFLCVKFGWIAYYNDNYISYINYYICSLWIHAAVMLSLGLIAQEL